MKKILLALLLLTGCTVKHEVVIPTSVTVEEMTPGYDVLGISRYCSTFLKAPLLPAFSTLLKSPFGDPVQCIEDRIAKGGVKKIQLDLIDATCYRRNACPPDAPKMPALGAVRARARVAQELAIAHPEIEWWISPWLEHDVKNSDIVKAACSEINKACPTCKCLNSPFTGAKPKGIPVELHGTKASSFSISGDGSSSFDGDNLKNDGNNFQHRIAGSNQTYGWFEELNLRCSGEKNFTPIPNRTARPELWQFNVLNKIMTSIEDDKPRAPLQCKQVRQVDGKKGEIVKPFAEFYCNGDKDDGRGNKPMLILRKSGTKGQLLTVRNGSDSIGCFRDYGPYTVKGLYRWYMGSCSGQNSWELYQALGQEWGYLELGNGNCLLFNAIRRQGTYR